MTRFVPRVQRHEYELTSMVPFYHVGRQYLDIVASFPRAKSILIIGVGDGLLIDALRRRGCSVASVDIDRSLKPDYAVSVHELSSVRKRFDVVVCSNVLEHLPFTLFEQSLNELFVTARLGVLITLPYAGFVVGGGLQGYPFFQRWFGIKVPVFCWKRHRFDGQHYWEIGTRGYPLSRIRRLLQVRSASVRITRNPEWGYSYHFVCTKR